MKTNDTQFPTIYVDEAGNTGSNICDESQKYFILSAVSFSKEELDKIITDIPYDKELHFIDMKNSIAGRKAIKDILSHPLLDNQHVSYHFIDKSFCACAYITDYLIEPVFHYIYDFDLYKKKNNIIYANLLYALLLHHKERGIVEAFIMSFMKMMREQLPESIDEFYLNTNILLYHPETDKNLQDLLFNLLPSKDILDYILIKDNKYSLDATLTSLFRMIYHWSDFHNCKINIVTDDSKQLMHQENIIDKLSKIKDETIVGYDTRKHKYPLPINNFEMTNSKTSIGVQIADLVASAVAFRWNNTTKKYQIFQNELSSLDFFDLPCLTIRPADSKELDAMLKTKEDSSDIDPLDFLADNL